MLQSGYREERILSGNYGQLSVSGAQGQHGRDTKDKDGETDLDIIAKSLPFVLKGLGESTNIF